jgi:predicted NBD/HSP70 family sugar kinase
MATTDSPLNGSGAGELFQLLRDGTPRTRSELATLSGLSRATISSRVDDLLASGLIRSVRSAASTGGRPSARVALNASSRFVAAAQFGASHATLALMDLSGALLIEKRSQRDISSGPAESLDWVSDTMAALIEEAGCSSRDLIGIGVGLPGPVEHATGRPTSPPIMPGWDGYDVPHHLQQTFGVPVLVDNDVNMMALGEQSNVWPDVRNMIFVTISTGIGAGIISAGNLQRGETGSAGDIGHIEITRGAGIKCHCGNSGCLEAVAGIPAVMASLRSKGIELSSVDQLIALAKTGDQTAVRAIRQVGRDVGEVLKMCVSIFNPSVIVVGGRLFELSDQLIAGMREVIYSRFMPLATTHLNIVPTQLGPSAGVRGAGLMVIEDRLSPAAIDELLT